MTKEQLEQKATQLYEANKLEENLKLLTDELLGKHDSGILYELAAGSYFYLEDYQNSFKYIELAIKADPTSSFSYTTKGNILLKLHEYENSIIEFDKALTFDLKFLGAYLGKAMALYQLDKFQDAINTYNIAILIDNESFLGYRHRGFAYYKIKEFDYALKDFTKAIELGDNELGICYNMKGNVFFIKKLFQKAITEYDLSIHHSKEKRSAFFNKGLALFGQKKYQNAIKEYSTAISIDPNYASAYRARARAEEELTLYKEAIADHEKYILLTNNTQDYRSQVSIERINALHQKLKNLWYDEIDKLVEQVKSLLLFQNKCVTHFTSLSSAKSMILESSPFRLSEGNFLNDTSEGRELFNYFAFSFPKILSEDTVAEVFTERPFIGSFVSDNKHDDLTLWRMYGKEKQAEAKGCALTIVRADFIKGLEEMVTLGEDTIGTNDKETVVI